MISKFDLCIEEGAWQTIDLVRELLDDLQGEMIDEGAD